MNECLYKNECTGYECSHKTESNVSLVLRNFCDYKIKFLISSFNTPCYPESI